MANDENNLSDHLAISMDMTTFKITTGETPESQAFVHSFPRTNWDCDKFKTRYRNNLMELLKDVPIQDVSDIKTIPGGKSICE